MAYVGNPIDTQNTFQSLVGKRFNGDGSTTDFTLDVAPSSTLDIEVFVGNVRQDPNSAYTVSGTTLSFTGAPPSGTNNVYVVHQAKSVGTIDVPDSSVNSDKLTGNLVTPGTLDVNGQELILDADADTSITADTDDQIDIKIAGADDFKFTANNFNILSGSTLTVDSGATITNSGTANGFGALTKVVELNITSSTSAVELNDSTSGLFDGTFRTYMLVMNEVKVSGANEVLQMQFRNQSNSSYITSSYAFISRAIDSSDNVRTVSSTSANQITFLGSTDGIGDGSGNFAAEGVIYFVNFNQTDSEQNMFGKGSYNKQSGYIATNHFAGKYRDTSSQIDGIKIFPGGGTITNGNFRIYGLVNS
jgi:hypothetical protein